MAAILAAILLLSATTAWAHPPPPPELIDSLSPAAPSQPKPMAPKPVHQPQGAALPVRFQADLSQTAIWRGDQFEYRITLVYPPEVEIVRDNFKAEGLNVEPFVLLGLDTQARAGAGVQILELRLKLALLEGTGREATIPPLTIYYATRKAGPLGKGTDIETHSLVIPEKVVGVGTTLTKDSKDIRDAATAFPVATGSRVFGILGWGMVGIVGLQVAFAGVAYYRRRSQGSTKRDRRAVERQTLQRLEQLGADLNGKGALPEQFGELSSTLRDAIAGISGIEATNLTPREIKADLLRMNAEEPLAESIRDVLDHCQQMRYRRAGSPDGHRSFGDLIENSRAAVSELARL
jgi:hypothetical protein